MEIKIGDKCYVMIEGLLWSASVIKINEKFFDVEVHGTGWIVTNILIDKFRPYET